MKLTIEQFRKWGKQGGRKRAKNITAKRRKVIARKAARKRWSKREKQK